MGAFYASPPPSGPPVERGFTMFFMTSLAEGRAAAPATRHSWIAGREVEGRGGTRAAINPTTGRAFGQTSLLDAEQAKDALAAAREAFPGWSGLAFRERG